MSAGMLPTWFVKELELTVRLPERPQLARSTDSGSTTEEGQRGMPEARAAEIRENTRSDYRALVLSFALFSLARGNHNQESWTCAELFLTEMPRVWIGPLLMRGRALVIRFTGCCHDAAGPNESSVLLIFG